MCLLHQRVEFIHILREHAKRCKDALLLREIHASGLELLNRVVAAAALEEVDIALHRTAVEDIIRELDRRAKPGCILIDIERIVKMRDAHPLQRDVVVHMRAVVIQLVERAVDLRQALDRERLAALRHGVRPFFELREHRLPEAGRAERFQKLRDVIRAFSGIRFVRQQVVGHQRFVDR
ncbi:hypothetical protein SDC9_113355 [bioreactor metagenome]|uniref:Uncharacterized protein n=1 Tax=bioreactor metagenome TaxID=1076179 RepID=A0A645BMU8_9ZZZZ